MTRSRKSKISIFDVLSTLGMSMVGFFTFMGEYFYTGGQLGISIAYGVGAVALLTLFLWAAIRCKRVEADFSRWRVVEIAAVVMFFAAAVYPARMVTHFFDILSQKSELQAAAHADMDAFGSMFAEYETKVNNALDNTSTNLRDAFGQPRDRASDRYFYDNHIYRQTDIDSWIKTQRDLLVGDASTSSVGISYFALKSQARANASEWAERIDDWDITNVATSSTRLEELAEEVAQKLTALSASGKLPLLRFNDGEYCMTETNQAVKIEAPAYSFAKAISGKEWSKSIIFYIIYGVIIILILLDYVMTPRSIKTRIKYDSNTPVGGNLL